MKATEAAKIRDEYIDKGGISKLDEILNSIESAAKEGRGCIAPYSPLAETERAALENLGYSISDTGDAPGIAQPHIISW